IPWIEFREIVFAQAKPRLALSAAGERLLIEWWDNIAVDAADALVVIAATVIPEAVVVIERSLAAGDEFVCDFVKIVREARANPSRNKTRDAEAELLCFIRTNVPAPPSDV